MLGTWDFKKFFFSLQGIILLLIIAVLGFSVLFAFINSGSAASDQKRLADVGKIQAALKVSYGVNGYYPDSANNQPKGIDAILDFWPVAPMRNGRCSAAQNTYTYAPRSNGSDYSFTFCLGTTQGNLGAGVHTLNSEGIE